jgi:hypothetical protein
MIYHLLLSFTFAAIPPEKPISISAEELISLPAANRVQVASKIKTEKISEQLWQMAFDEKKDMGSRWKSLTLAAQINREKASASLEKAIKSDEWFMRNAALVAYKEVFPDQATAVAEKLLQDKALVVRSAAVEALPSNLTNQMRDKLWAELYQDYNFRKKQSLFVRSNILQKLAESPRAQEKVLFVKALQEQDPRLHTPAVSALEKISNKILGDRKTKFEKKRALWLNWAKKNI